MVLSQHDEGQVLVAGEGGHVLAEQRLHRVKVLLVQRVQGRPKLLQVQNYVCKDISSHRSAAAIAGTVGRQLRRAAAVAACHRESVTSS